MSKHTPLKRSGKTGYAAQDKQETAYIVQPVKTSQPLTRNIEDILEEAEGLARAISLRVTGSRVARIQRINPALFLGKGTVEEIVQEIIGIAAAQTESG